MSAVTFRLDPLVKLTDETFIKLCQANSDLKFESTAQGELTVMSLTGGESEGEAGRN